MPALRALQRVSLVAALGCRTPAFFLPLTRGGTKLRVGRCSSSAYPGSPSADDKKARKVEDEEEDHRAISRQELRQIFEGNRRWVRTKLQEDKKYFEKLEQGQTPRFLFIGCSDSRVPANDITGLEAGELFVHRNIANLVVNSDLNLLSVLQYAVQTLRVDDIIVCGHYGCGGVAAALEHKELGLIDHWLRNIRDVSSKYHDELLAIPDIGERRRRLVELNVKEQCANLYRNSIIQRERKERGGFPHIHGLIYDVANGLLQLVDTKEEDKDELYDHIYRLFYEEDEGESPPK